MRNSPATLVMVFCSCAALLSAAPKKTVPGTTAPACDITRASPDSSKSLAADQLMATAIVPNTSYYKTPCYRAVVDFMIAEETGGSQPHPYEDFFFDSIGNEQIDTQEKCQTYQQTTEVYQKKNGAWSQKDKGRLVGTWSGGKCKFDPPAGQSDFRITKYSPLADGESHFRVVSTVTTGKGMIWGPENQPNRTTFTEANVRGKATPQQVCFAVEHAHNDNTLPQGCSDPVP